MVDDILLTDSLLITVEPIASSGMEATGVDLSALLTPVEVIATTSLSTEQVIDVAAVAAMPLSGHRVIRESSFGAIYADNNDGPHVSILGVSLHAAMQGASIAVRVAGVITEPSWAFYQGPVFLGPVGTLTQIPPPTGSVVEVGTAINTTTLLVRVQQVFIHD